MKIHRPHPLALAAAVVLTVAAVASFASAAPAAPKAPGGGVISKDGFRLVGSARMVAFGEPEAEVVAFAGGVFGGAPTRSKATNCRNGVFDYADWNKGLKLVFQDGKLVGWVADRRLAPGYTNRAGIEFNKPVSAMKAQNGGLILADAVKGKAFGFDGLYGQVWQPGPSATLDVLAGGADCKPR